MAQKRETPTLVLPTGSVENLPKRLRKSESIWKSVKMEDLETYGIRVGKSILCQTSDQVRCTGHLPKYIDFAGLDAVKAMLTSNIGLVCASPQFFSVSPHSLQESTMVGGKTPLQHIFYIYGSEGSGKRTLLKSFCAAHEDLSLVQVNPATFNPATDTELLYKTACENSPAIVLLDSCDGHYHRSNPSTMANASLLWDQMKKMEEHRLPVWTIFTSIFPPDSLQQLLTNQIVLACWTSKLTTLDCEKLWRRAIARYSQTEKKISDEDFSALSRKSTDLNAGDIESIVKKVCANTVQSQGKDLARQPTKSLVLVPSFNDYFVHVQNTKFYFEKNIIPYSQGGAETY